MRRKQFGKLLTISLSDEVYGLIEDIAREHRTSMGGIVRDSIEHSIGRGDWAASKPRPFTREGVKGESTGPKGHCEPEEAINDRTSTSEEGEKDEQ